MKQNPVVGVGAVVIYNAKVLLVQRATPPFVGQWCIPGGKVRFGETLQAAAEREILEETGIVIKAGEPIFSFDVISSTDAVQPFHYVVIDLKADYVSGELKAASDAGDAAWFTPEEINRPDVQATTQQLLRRYWISNT